LPFLKKKKKRKKEKKEKKNLTKAEHKYCNIHLKFKNLLLRTVISCASASSDGLGPNPHLVRCLSVTKEWKLLSKCRRALWTRSR